MTLSGTATRICLAVGFTVALTSCGSNQEANTPPESSTAVEKPTSSANVLPDSADSTPIQISPDVYSVAAENEKITVMLATWKVDQSDEWHTHHGDLANYSLTDCTLEVQNPNGTSTTAVIKAGDIGFNVAGNIHKVRNIGSQDCKMYIFENKE